jgi:hypothetical protein
MARSAQRYLDPSEAVHAFLDWSTSFAVTCEGPLDQAAMTEAVAILAARAPLMRGHIEKTERGFLFAVTPGGAPEVVTGPATQAACLAAMGTPLDSSRSLARVTILPGEAVSYVVLVLHHSIADAPNCVALFALLWENYAAVVGGQRQTPAPAQELPASAERLFLAQGTAPEWQSPAWESEAAAATAELAAAAGVIRLAHVVPDRIRLDADTTALLIQHVRDAGLSLHAYVCGAALIACRGELWGDLGARPVRLGCPIDLRSTLSTPVQATEVTNLSDGIHTDVVVHEDDDPVEVGRQLGEGLHKAIDSGQAERAIMDPQYKRPRAGLPVDHVVSNIGALPVPATPPGLAITDFHGYQSMTITGATLHVVSLYAGQLSVELISPDGLLSADQRQRITARTQHLLRDMAAAR